ncbi:DUF4913 domain-containing protein [Saccharopolyspora shandongensis]|uniref:DUF4913 domain-containing protein n=1 Tax=Saccharopolyspora shandongensis TaxID=418495 RepID=UPI00341B9C42
MYCRPLGDYRWCAQWWKHSEAVSRFHALWHAWGGAAVRTGDGHGRVVPRSPRSAPGGPGRSATKPAR